MKSSATIKSGPADGIIFNVDYTPIMLRVASNGPAHRVLNNNDAPTDQEAVTAYIMAGKPSVAFWDGRDPKTGRRIGGQASRATYVPCDLQPPRVLESWPQWCKTNQAALMAEHERRSMKAGV